MGKFIKHFSPRIVIPVLFSILLLAIFSPTLAAYYTDTFSDTSKINTGSSSGYQVTGGQLKIALSGDPDGTACSSDSTCLSGICGTNADSDTLFSAAAGHTGTCQATALAYTDCDDSTASIGSHKATGGTVSYVSGWVVHKFTTSGTFNVTCGGTMTAQVLVVAGGGGGGQDYGGGGGAGGVIFNSAFSIPQTSYSITVGAGGGNEQNGSNSVFSTLTAIGGGRGARYSTGSAGGSGGGAGYFAAAGGAGTSGQGYNGGTSGNVNYRGSGGGGASQVGYANNAATNRANGGNGTDYSAYFGTSVGESGYFGGGGGAASSAAPDGIGGMGGGGDARGGSGIANTGGGGSSCAGLSCIPGNGGSGIVLIRYPNP